MKESKNGCMVLTSSRKRKVRQFHVVVVQQRQEKSVMHLQSRCFANFTLLLFCRSCYCPYIYVWIHGHRSKKNLEFEADPASKNVALKSRKCKSPCNNFYCNSIGNRKIRTRWNPTSRSVTNVLTVVGKRTVVTFVFSLSMFFARWPAV